MGQELLCPKFFICVMMLIFLLQRTGPLILNSYIYKNAIFNPKKKKKEKRFLYPKFFISYNFFGRNNPLKFHAQVFFFIYS